MAESINLRGDKSTAKPNADVSGEVPPPASLPEGVSGNPPLPVGRAVRAVDPKHLTDKEKSDLKKAGWVEGEPIPSDMTAQVNAAQAAAKSDYDEGAKESPVSADAEPVKLDTKPIDSLDKDDQSKFLGYLKEALEDPKEQPGNSEQPSAEAQQASQPEQSLPEPEDTDIRLSEQAQKVASAKQLNVDFGDPERPGTGVTPDPDYVAPEPSEPASQPQKSESLSYCPHCHWDLSVPDDTDPTDGDKQSFLTALLGLQPFRKTYSQLNDRLKLTFRTLTAQELDAVFAQAFVERQRDQINNPVDYNERVNRLRFFLQLSKVETDGNVRELPDGLSQAANPSASAVWEIDEDEKEPLRLIENWLLANVLRSESLIRIAQLSCYRFNRLVTKLEAVVDDPDFWKAAEPQH